jgi:hypothetical protein
VLKEHKLAADNPTFTVVAVYDPRFENPLLLACPLQLSGFDFWCLYHNRWPIEQLPLASKQMVGAQHQFVSAEESCSRLPELSLPAGSMHTNLAATLPLLPPAFGTAIPKAPQVDYAGGWAERLSQTCSLCNKVESDESHRSQTICPRGIHAQRRSKQPALA